MKTIKCSVLHRIGNIIQAFVSIFEHLITILSFGFLYPNWTMKFVMWRLKTTLYSDKKINFYLFNKIKTKHILYFGIILLCISFDSFIFNLIFKLNISPKFIICTGYYGFFIILMSIIELKFIKY